MIIHTNIETAIYAIPYITISLDTTYDDPLLQSQQFSTLLQHYNLCYDTLNTQPIELLSMNKATARPLLEDPRRCAHQERLGER
jgi:hypothetical protein